MLYQLFCGLVGGHQYITVVDLHREYELCIHCKKEKSHENH